MDWKTAAAEFFSESDRLVKSTNVFGAYITIFFTLVAVPAAIMALCAFYHHVWTLHKGLEGGAVQLILALIGGGGAGCGVGYGISRFSSTTVSKIEGANVGPAMPKPPIQPGD